MHKEKEEKNELTDEWVKIRKDYMNEDEEERKSRLQDSVQLKKFLKLRSEFIKDLESVDELGVGGQNTIYSVGHGGIQEIVAKVPHFDETNPSECFFETLEETLFLLEIENDYTIKVHEYIIDYNEETNSISRLCVVLERAV